MSDIGQLVQACVASGIILSSLCAMVVVPVVLWFAIRRLAPAIVAMNADPAWQAPIAASAAALPGLAFGLFAMQAVITGSKSECLAFVSGRILFGIVILLAIVAIVRASIRAFQRHAEVTNLFSHSVVPTNRLEAIGAALGLHVRTLLWDAPFCALAGVFRPTVFVSVATEDALSDEELRAALLHERAHRTRHDQLLVTILTFATDLLPLPVEDLVVTYHRARELAADRCAAEESDPVHIAGAIVAVVRGRALAYAAALSSEPAIVHIRLNALLGSELVRPIRSKRLLLASTLTVLTILTAFTAIASLVVSAACAPVITM